MTALTNYGAALLTWPTGSSNTVVLLDGFPPWDTNGVNVASWLPDWTNYVNRVVSYLYAPPFNCRYFQVWNEPFSPATSFWPDGTWSDFFAYVHFPAVQVIHSYPGAKVVFGGYPSASTASVSDYINQLSAYGAWTNLDVLDLHYYSPYQWSTLRAAADSRGYTNMFMWQTEVGWGGYSANGNSFVANEYPKALYWSLTNNWNAKNKYKWIFFCESDSAGRGLYTNTSSGLTCHGQQLQELAAILGTNVLSPYFGVTSSLSGLDSAHFGYGSTSAEAIRSGSKIAVFVHLSPTDYASNATVTLTLPINTNLISSVQRVDLTGNVVSLTPVGTPTTTTVTVSTHDAANTSAYSWNSVSIAAGKAATFYVVFALTQENMALNQTAVASSIQATNYLASMAVDGNLSTRWSSAFTDNEWIYVDLGAVVPITGVTLVWEAAYGKSYKIQVSNDASSWTDVYSTSNGQGGTENIAVSANARYVRMLGIQRATSYGYSLWEFQVFGNGYVPANGAIYQLICRTSNMALDNGGTKNLGAAVTQYYAVSGNTNQLWQLSDVGSGYYNLICQTSGMALDNGGSTTAGTTNTQYTIGTGNINQYWKFTAVGQGYYNVICQKSGMALDNAGSTVAGHPVTQWNIGAGNSNQFWQLIFIR